MSAREQFGNRWGQDCHALPQVLHAHACETILPKAKWDEQVAPWLERVAGVLGQDARLHLNGNKPSTAETQVDERCWVNMKASTLDKVRSAFHLDFQTFGFSTNPYADKAPTRGTSSLGKAVQVDIRLTLG